MDEWPYNNIYMVVKECTDDVYVYEFTKTNTAYVGRCSEHINRDNLHKKNGDSLFEYAKAHGFVVPPMKMMGFLLRNGLSRNLIRLRNTG